MARNLVAGDTNGAIDVFVWTRVTSSTGVLTRIAAGNGDSSRPSVSADGSVVAFQSAASNLLSGDTNGKPDIYTWERKRP